MGLGTDSLKRSGRGVTLSVAAALAACVLSSAAPASATRFVAPRPAPRAQQAQVLNGLRAFLYTPNPANGTQLASLMTSVSLNDTPELRHGVAAAVTARLADFARLPADAAAPEAALAPAQRDARAVLVMLQAPAFQSALADQHRNMATFDAVMLEARRHGAALAPERSEALFQEALARARALEAGTRQVEAVDAAFEPVLAAQPRTLPRPSGLGKSARRAAADAPRMERVPRPSAGRRDERAAPGAGFVMSRRAVALMRQGLAAVFAVAAGSLAVSLAAAAFGPGAAFLLLGGVALTATAGGLLRKAPRFALANAVLATGLLAMGLPAVVPGAESLAASLALAALVSAATVAAFAPRRAASFVIATAKRVPGAYRAAAAASPAVAPFIAALLAVAAASSAAFFVPATPLLAAAAMAGAAAALAAPSLFLSRRAGPRAAGALAVGLAGAGLSLAMLNPLPLLAATAVAAGAYALKGAK
ncbi:MAG: hypothetical protein SF051_11460, partial [Elusimicrobiota bacterium]|nr:hypothetical protein [Elusimicrobiota bacterium]